MNTLILTVGLPRSGKSTWARTQNLPMVNPDSIRLAVYGRRYWQPGEDLVWASAKIMARSLFLAGHDKVIVDATNTTEKRRKFWRFGDCRPTVEWLVVFKEFRTDMNECIRRAGNDPELVAVIERMAEQLEWPAEGSEIWAG